MSVDTYAAHAHKSRLRAISVGLSDCVHYAHSLPRRLPELYAQAAEVVGEMAERHPEEPNLGNWYSTGVLGLTEDGRLALVWAHFGFAETRPSTALPVETGGIVEIPKRDARSALGE